MSSQWTRLRRPVGKKGSGPSFEGVKVKGSISDVEDQRVPGRRGVHQAVIP